MNAQCETRLAVLGMIPGNEHPYSWSAIINGFDPKEMAARCPSPTINRYLNEQPFDRVRIPGARVTHVWTENSADRYSIAAASLIPNVVDRPEDVIGQVDGVLIATDDGDDHIRRVAPFVEANLPVFVDKPLATNIADLRQFVRWQQAGASLLSSAGTRYARELDSLRGPSWLWLTGIVPKSWERYGIHLLEPVLTLLGPGFTEARMEKIGTSKIVQLTHASGVPVTLAAIPPAVGSFGVFHAYNAEEHRQTQIKDYYTAFRNQLLTVVDFVRTGKSPFPFEQTVELMAAIIAGKRSGDEGGRKVALEEIYEEIREN